MKGMGYKRYQRRKHIKRKEQILRKSRLDNPPHYYNDNDMWNFSNRESYLKAALSTGYYFPFWIVPSKGYLNKGKIHCGCGMCMEKTRNKGNRRRVPGNYASSINYKVSDLKKVNHMAAALEEWYEEPFDIEAREREFEEAYGWLRNKYSEEFFQKWKEDYCVSIEE